jgi:hypothetical protein
MLNRRLLMAAGASTLGALAGCSQFINEATTFEASKGTIPQSALDETGYEEQRVKTHKIERTFEVEGQSQTVEVVNWQAEYDKSIDFSGQTARAAVFTVLSTPQVKLFDKVFNPVKKMSTEELAKMVQKRYDGANNVQSVGSETMTILGSEVSVSKFTADAKLQNLGQSVEVVLRIGKVKHDGDFVLPIAVYPKLLESAEASNAETLLKETEH